MIGALLVIAIVAPVTLALVGWMLAGRDEGRRVRTREKPHDGWMN